MTLPPWRSLLYVPAHNEKFIAGASRRGADAIILDLEDGVPPDAKDSARRALKQAARQVGDAGDDVLVRINRPWRLAWRDLEAAVEAGVEWLLLPKVETVAQVQVVGELLSELESQRTQTKLILLFESAKGLLAAADLLQASSRTVAVIPGNEDLATDLGIVPEPAALLYAYVPLILAARSAGIELLGLIGSGANFRDLGAYRQRAEFARSWGFRGATCIHPGQVTVLNEVFATDAVELEWAEAVVAAFKASDGEPVKLDGQMIDLPVAERARRLLRARSK